MRTALAAPHTAALDAARASGGNALDVALAAATTLIVAYSHQNHLGGDLIALVRDPDGTVHAVLSAGAAPVGVDVDAIRAANERMPGQGPHPVTVPGIAAGWDALSKMGATLPLSHHLHAAATLAEEGLPVAPDLARAIVNRQDAIAADPGLSSVFGTAKAGDLLRQPALAASLRTVADDGIAAIYGGPIGERIAAFLASLGLRDDHRGPGRPRGADHRAARRRGARRDVARRAAPDAGRHAPVDARRGRGRAPGPAPQPARRTRRATTCSATLMAARSTSMRCATHAHPRTRASWPPRAHPATPSR